MTKSVRYYDCFLSRVSEIRFNRIVLASTEEEAVLKFQAWLDTPEGEASGYVRDCEDSTLVVDEVGPMEYQVQLDES